MTHQIHFLEIYVIPIPNTKYVYLHYSGSSMSSVEVYPVTTELQGRSLHPDRYSFYFSIFNNFFFKLLKLFLFSKLSNLVIIFNVIKTIFITSKQCCMNSLICQMELIYPSHSDVMSSYDGPLGGGCLPYRQQTHSKQPWLIDHMFNWRAAASNRLATVFEQFRYYINNHINFLLLKCLKRKTGN